MAEYYHAMVGLRRDNGLPKDTCWNNWHFDSTGTGTRAQDIADINTALLGFYQDANLKLSPFLTGIGEIKMYDMQDPEPRATIYDSTFAFTPGTAVELPCEVCVAFSFQGDRISGQSQKRRRGRIFVGPLGGEWGSGGVGDLFTAAARNGTLQTRGAALLGNLGTHSEIHWCVFSPTTLASTGLLSAAHIHVTNGWSDNAFDTQRRRGSEATTRYTFS